MQLHKTGPITNNNDIGTLLRYCLILTHTAHDILPAPFFSPRVRTKLGKCKHNLQSLVLTTPRCLG